MRVSRRSFVASASIAGLASVSNSIAAPGGRRRVAICDVAVIGAGLAGLNAALTLAAEGMKVVVLEGSGRVGGRVHTARDWHAAPDLGGVQIGPMYARVRDVARRLKIELAPGAHVNAPYSFVLGDNLIPAKQWEASPLNKLVGSERRIPPQALNSFYVEQRAPFNDLDDWLKPEAAQYDISLGAWLRDKGASSEAQQFIRLTQGLASLESASVLRMLQESTRSRADVRALVATEETRGMDVFQRFALASSHAIGGTSVIPEAMATALGDAVRLEHVVREIRQHKGGCDLVCGNGARFRARFVVAAVPFGVLRQIRITPDWPAVQGEAVRQMPYHNQSQVWLRVRKPFWEQDGIEASMWTDGVFTLIRQQIEPDGRRELISCLSFNDRAKELDAMTHADRGRFAIATLEKIRPAMRGQLEFVGAHSWLQVPLVRGCSHQFRPGRAFDWTHEFIKPHGFVHIAGEHTRRLEVGMEAAMESGERCALEILERASV
jgi:monoamine oxidase